LKDLNDGELEIGQIAGLIHKINSAEEIVLEMMTDLSKKKF
jgi:hypothetical protein